MNAQEQKEKYTSLYNYMAKSKNPEYMMLFGKVMTQMMEDTISSNPLKAEEYIERLCAIKWKNYLTQKEAEKIVAEMTPKAPWSRDLWMNVMSRQGFEREHEPEYNSCALWVAMNMIMSDSSQTLSKYIKDNDLFHVVYELAVDKLTDKDGKFNIRKYFNL